PGDARGGAVAEPEPGAASRAEHAGGGAGGAGAGAADLFGADDSDVCQAGARESGVHGSELAADIQYRYSVDADSGFAAGERGTYRAGDSGQGGGAAGGEVGGDHDGDSDDREPKQ